MGRPDGPFRAGDDRGERAREVEGDALTDEDAAGFAALLGVDPEA